MAAFLLPLLSVTGAQASVRGDRPGSVRADRFQADAIAAALRRVPSGKRIAANEIEWDSSHGKVIMVVPASPDARAVSASPDGSPSSCPSGIFTGQWTCVYSESHFNGVMLQFQDAGYPQDLYYYGGYYWLTNSWSNTRGQRTWIRPDKWDGNPPELCMTGNAAAGEVGVVYRPDRWIYLTGNYDKC